MTLPPIARDSDPSTSKQAAARVTESGDRRSLMDICLAFVTAHPGYTAGEIGDVTGLGHVKVWRRLSDLKNTGQIVAGPPRKWQGRAQATWWPAEKQGQFQW